MHGGPRHGPYYARFWWRDGHRYKRYVRQRDAADGVAACSARREAEREGRVRTAEARQAWCEIRAQLREIERGER
jgi:hypothetical protein